MTRLALVAVAVVVLSGCASVAPQKSAEVLSAEQMGVYQADLEAMKRACAGMGKHPNCVPLPTVVQHGALPDKVVGRMGQYGKILIDETLYASGFERERMRVLMHEAAHVMLWHWHSGRRCHGTVCELHADIYSVSLIHHAWGLSMREAASLVYEGLLRRLHFPAMHGHASGCEEATAFARQFNLMAPGCGARAVDRKERQPHD